MCFEVTLVCLYFNYEINGEWQQSLWTDTVMYNSCCIYWTCT